MYLHLDEKKYDKLAVIDMHENRVTYGEFCSDILEMGKLLMERTIALILCSNEYIPLLFYISCIEKKVVPLLVSRTTSKELLNNFINIYHPAYIFGKTMDLKEKEITEGNILTCQKLKENAYEVIQTVWSEKQYPLYEELSLLLTTSGSTGSPKLVRHSYTNLDIQAKNIACFFEMDGHERPMCDLPMEYTMGLSIINSHLYAGATLLLSDISITQKEFWDYFKKEKATSFFGVPYSYEILKRFRIIKMDLPSLELLSQGGGKLSKELNYEFAEYIISKGGKYIATYGQTEGTARMAYLPSEYALTKMGSIGRAIPQGKLYLLDENGNKIITPNTEGEMVYEGPNVTLGYAQTGNDLILGDEWNGVLPTGDLAYFDEDGFFYISGRLKRFLKLFGYRVNLDECERLIEEEFSVSCACTGDDTKLIAFVTGNEDIQKIKEFLINITKLYPTALIINKIDKIPRSTAGKVKYSDLPTKGFFT